jgi:hypothetical protein
MFLVHEATLLRNSIGEAETVLAIAQSEIDLRRRLATARSLMHREESLRFEWQELDKKISSDRDVALDSLNDVLKAGLDELLLSLVKAEEERIQVVSKANEDSIKESEDITRKLKQARGHFDALLAQVSLNCRDACQHDAKEAEDQSHFRLSQANEQFSRHRERITRLHDEAEQSLVKHFESCLKASQSEIGLLNTRLNDLSQEIEQQNASIERVTSENAVVSKPLKQFQVQKQSLTEKMKIVDAAIMACANFNNAVKSLRGKLESINKEILSFACFPEDTKLI